MSTLQHVFRKTASDESENKAKESDYELGLRHLFYPARLATLQGMPVDAQVDANWGRLKELPMRIPFEVAVGALGSAYPGGGAGFMLTSGPVIHAGTKAIFKIKKAGNTYPYHMLAPARVISYAGGNVEQQRQANWDHIKILGSSLLGGGLGGTLGYLTADKMDKNPFMGAVSGALLGGAGGHAGSFLYMLNKRKNKK
jgi:hypothetical protein